MKFVDKTGSPFEVRHCESGDLTCLVEMYDIFTPKAGFQGMPPQDGAACRKWIEKLLSDGVNFLAIRESRVIGHVVVIPDTRAGDAEYLIFVNKDDRNRGVGSRLTQTVLEHAREMGIKKIWLTVGRYNFIAVRLYSKFGFVFVDEACESERSMALRL